MPETLVLWLLGCLFTLLLMIGGGSLAFILSQITEALKEIRSDLQLLGKEAEARIEKLSERVQAVEIKQELCQKHP
jgi:hypothetical protein